MLDVSGPDVAREPSVSPVEAPFSRPRIPGTSDCTPWPGPSLRGVLLRVGRYLLNFPFWGDESMLIQNYLDRDYADLLQPLTLQQVAPLGYLVIE